MPHYFAKDVKVIITRKGSRWRWRIMMGDVQIEQGSKETYILAQKEARETKKEKLHEMDKEAAQKKPKISSSPDHSWWTSGRLYHPEKARPRIPVLEALEPA